jgi:DNA-binding beta-propeller fold protein YncE
LVVCASLAGCGRPANAPACVGVCVAPSWTRLDLVAGQPGGSGLVDGVGAAVHFSDPWTFTGDGRGTLWIADASVIRAADEPSATVTTLAGRFGVTGGSDGVGAAASFFQPGGMALFDDTIFLCDTENHALRTIDVKSGAVALYAGAIGEPGTDDGPIASARFREPEGIVYDGAGSLYVGDVDNNTIRRIDIIGGLVSTVAGQVGVDGSGDGVGPLASFHKPKQLALDGAGNLYIVDYLNTSIRKMSLADFSVTTLATFPLAPNGVAAVGDEVWAALADHTIARIDAAGNVTTVAGASNVPGFADGAGGDARFFLPAGLWIEPDRVLVADDGNCAVRAIARDSGAVTTILGAIADGSTDGAGGRARFAAPQGLAVAGSVAWVADTGNDTIRRVDLATSAVTTIAGAAGQANWADGTGSDARFNAPLAVALDDAGGTLFVADSGNRSIRAVDLATSAVTTLALVGAPGSMFVRFDTPSGLAQVGTHLYVSDAGDHDILDVDLLTQVVFPVAGTPRVAGSNDGVGALARFNSPSGLVADGRGTLYVADTLNDAVRKIDLASATVSTLAGTPGFTGANDGTTTLAHFARPIALALDGLGDLFVADSANSVVRLVDLNAGMVSTPIGSLAQSGVALGPLPAQLGTPTALALTPDGQLLVASESSLLLAH